jgi:hypothetical protein
MPDPTTSNKALYQPAHVADVDTWEIPMNSNAANIDLAFGGSVTINATAASGTVALTSAQYIPLNIVVSGTLSANVNYQFPASVRGNWFITNSTSGAFSLTFSSADGGTSYVLAQGSRANVQCDSTGVRVGSAAAGANSDITSLSGLTTPLTVAQGGTGKATITSGALQKGAGTSAMADATAGTDYAKPDTASTWTAIQTLSGSSSTFAEKITNAKEAATVSATAATGTITYYVNSQSVLYFTTNASANWTLNLTFSAGTTMNSALSTGEVATCVFLVTMGSTTYYNTTVQVDGSTSGVTTKWLGGAPTAGIASAINLYEFAVIKTGSGTFTVIASLAWAS